MTRARITFSASLLLTSVAVADLPPVGAAPKGDPAVVASRIIKFNFPNCRQVTGARRAADGSIRATCDGTQYLVFTVFIAQEGKTLEVALNCAAAKQHLNVTC